MRLTSPRASCSPSSAPRAACLSWTRRARARCSRKCATGPGRGLYGRAPARAGAPSCVSNHTVNLDSLVSVSHASSCATGTQLGGQTRCCGCHHPQVATEPSKRSRHACVYVVSSRAATQPGITTNHKVVSEKTDFDFPVYVVPGLWGRTASPQYNVSASWGTR